MSSWGGGGVLFHLNHIIWSVELKLLCKDSPTTTLPQTPEEIPRLHLLPISWLGKLRYSKGEDSAKVLQAYVFSSHPSCLDPCSPLPWDSDLRPSASAAHLLSSGHREESRYSALYSRGLGLWQQLF